MRKYDLGKAPDIITVLKETNIYCNDSKGETMIISLIDIVGKERIDNLDKKLKAFEIIKKKRVNVHLLLLSDSLEKYNFNLLPYRKLNQEEYDLLKEVLL